MKINSKIKRFYHDEKCLVFLLVVLLGMTLLFANLFSSFNILPGPLFGGDAYYHQGHIQHIYHGGSPFMSAHTYGHYEQYSWLTHFVIAVLAWIIGSPYTAQIFAPILMLLLSGVGIFFLTRRLVCSEEHGLLLSLLWISSIVALSYSPSWFATYTAIPLLFLFMAKLETRKDYIYAGLLIGVFGLTHPTPFLAGMMYLCLDFVYKLWKTLRVKKKWKWTIKNKKFTKTLTINTIIAGVVGAGINMIYYGPLLLVYHMRTLNPWQEYTQDLSTSAVLKGGWWLFKSMFISFGNWQSGILTVLAILGVLSFFIIKSNKEHRNILKLGSMLFVIALLGFLHPIITQPLLGMSFGHYSFPRLIPFAKICFVFAGLYVFYNLVNKKIAFGFCAILFVVLFFFAYEQESSGQWLSAAQVEDSFTLAYQSFGEMLTDGGLKNDDVTLALHPESGFAFHAVTGSKVMYLRRTHASPFVNMEERYAHAAIILFGTDLEERKRLLELYSVDYIFIDPYGLQSTQKCAQFFSLPEDQKRQMAPNALFCLATDLEYETELNEQGIETYRTKMRKDPSSTTVPSFDMVLIKPNPLNLTDLAVEKYKLQDPDGNQLMALYEVI